MKTEKCIIIGCGTAGISAGIEFIKSREPEDCLIVGSQLTNSSMSPWNIRDYDRETLDKKMTDGGDNLGDEKLRETYLDNYEDAVSFMENIGLEFETSNLGVIPVEEQSALRKFHSHYLDLGGRIEDAKIDELLLRHGQIVGVGTKEGEEIFADQIILASGGMSNLFEYSSGYQSDSVPSILALSLKAGLEVENLEFIMYHPFLVVDDELPRALISGTILQNAKFLNSDGEPFLSEEIRQALRNNRHHDKFGEMTREFYRQSLKSDITVDISEIDSERFDKFKKENEYGWVFRGKKLEDVEQFKINPAFHYSLGGLVTDEFCRTSQEHVYAAGEITTGLHGSNRIGGTAIPEAVIFGRIAGQQAAEHASSPEATSFENKVSSKGIDDKLRKTFWKHLGPIRNEKDLKQLIEDLKSQKPLSPHKNLLLECVKSACSRKENVGSHYIE